MIQEIVPLTREENLKRLEPAEIGQYLDNLSSRLSQLSDILTKDKDDFVPPYISIIQNSLSALKLKHALTGLDKLDFSLTINPQNCGFPTVKDFYLLERDKEMAPSALEQMPSRKEIIEGIRSAVLRGFSPVTSQALLMKYNFYKNLEEMNILEESHESKPDFLKTEGSRRYYSLDWSCIERDSTLPVLYRMYLTQDQSDAPLHQVKKPILETLIYQSMFGMTNLKQLISCIDQSIDPIHPKLIYKYTIGPYENSLTGNTDELNAVFCGIENPGSLKFKVERVSSVGTRKKSTGFFRKLFGVEIEKEYYGELDDSDRRMIVPFRIKQKLGNKDESGRGCGVYGITEEGGIVA